MAHRIPGRTGRLRAAGIGALVALSLAPARALDVGDPQVRSAIGEPLDATLPVRAAPGERFAGKCFSVAPGMGMPDDPQLGVTLERSRDRARLRVRTGKAIAEPAIGLRVGVDCDQSGKALKDVPLLIDLPTRPARTAKPGNAEGDVAAPPGQPPVARTPAPRKDAAPRATPVPPASTAAAPASTVTAPVREAPAPPMTARPVPDARPGGAGFQLRLSTGEMDLAPSRRVDDKQREQLRGRLALLDADDQLSAMLAMRHQLQALESKVAALQLRIATAPESFPAPRAVPPAARVEAPKPAPVAESPKPAPVVEAPRAAEPRQAPAPVPRPATPAARGTLAEITAWIPAYALPLAGAILLLAAIAWFWRRRRRDVEVREEAPSAESFEEAPAAAPIPDLPLGEIAEPIELAQRPEDVKTPPVAAAPAAAAPLAAPPPEPLPDDAASLRQRYIVERFPEVAAGSIELSDAESVIKGARLFYEDGELPRAVELLQYTIETSPDDPRPWLALFEIFRLERLGGEFSQLATRFRGRFGDSEWWGKVRFFGREVDPGNPLYRGDEMPATLETIGPREARRLAAQNATYDPVTENWLRAPMDFQNEVLATELRRALMSDAALSESDLVPNPMPALRDIEMFTVA